MSHIANTQWLEAAQENLDTAVEQGHYQLALDIIADVEDKGFSVEARTMRHWLSEQPLSKFAIKSPYPNI